MIVLGLETSCDDTAAAILKDGTVLSNVVASQLDHSAYGGVVPEVASRLHEQKIVAVTRKALEKASLDIGSVGGIAATYGPGLAGALVVGLNFAKGLSQALGIPFVGVDHMEGHLFANFLDQSKGDLKTPFLCLLVSGGHTHIWKISRLGEYTLMGKTLDDAAGEAFDKGARLLGLGYPGGPALQDAAASGNPDTYSFPRPLAGQDNCNFSFSGLKTALYYRLKKMPRAEIKDQLAHLAASYQQAIVDVLLDRLRMATKKSGLNRATVAGGVSANQLLRKQLDNWRAQSDMTVLYPPLHYTTDNAAMIAMAGHLHLSQGKFSDHSLEIKPSLSLADRV